jgi:hypothetical protein
MRRSRLAEVEDAVLRGLGRGATAAETAAAAGIPERTLRNWIREGRLHPDSAYAPIAEAFDRRRRAKLVVVASDEPSSSDAASPDRVELLRRLDEQSRNGSTRATELLLREVGAEPPAEGPFAELDTHFSGTPRRRYPPD